MNQKIIDTLGSRNFYVSLVTLVLLAFEANNLPININPGELVDTVLTRDLGGILSILLLNFLNPIMKLANKMATWSWAFLRSPNFWTQITTVLLSLIAVTGITFPEGAAAELVTSVFGGSFNVIAMAVLVNVINPLYHFFFDRKKLSVTPQGELNLGN